MSSPPGSPAGAPLSAAAVALRVGLVGGAVALGAWLAGPLGAAGVAALAVGVLSVSMGRRRPEPPGGSALQSALVRALAEQARAEAVLESMHEAVFALDAAGRLTGANGAALHLLGRAQLPAGEHLADLLPALAVATTAAEGAHGVTLGATHFMARVSRLAAGRVVVLVDVTRLRQLEQIRRDFVANLSHELRTPVSVIRANAETLRDGALSDPSRARGFLDALLRSAERLSDLVADLLDIARIESGRYHLDLKPLAVVDPAVAAFELVEPLAIARRTTIDFDLDEGLVARADAKALTQVLTNLLENAVKYAPEGASVTVVGRRRGEVARLAVQDDGPGIPADQRDRVFERFYRLDPGRAQEDGGTGLGLAIVKHLVGAMGGRVGLEANAPHGSVFWVELPAGTLPPPVRHEDAD